jgi:hypothetical protein
VYPTIRDTKCFEEVWVFSFIAAINHETVKISMHTNTDVQASIEGKIRQTSHHLHGISEFRVIKRLIIPIG